jgi:hypothetical protein
MISRLISKHTKDVSQGSVFPPFTTHTQAMISMLSVAPFTTHTQAMISRLRVAPFTNTQISHDLKTQGFPRFKTYKRRETGLSVSPFTTHTKDMNQGSALSHFNTHTHTQDTISGFTAAPNVRYTTKTLLSLYSMLSL